MCLCVSISYTYPNIMCLCATHFVHMISKLHVLACVTNIELFSSGEYLMIILRSLEYYLNLYDYSIINQKYTYNMHSTINQIQT